MAIITARPPNFEVILRTFPEAAGPGVIFAYGKDIYNPSGGILPPALLAHEGVHQHRQMGIEDKWWEDYVSNAEFRYREELLAHAAEYKAQVRGLDRNRAAKLLMRTAARLIAPLYNYQPPRSLNGAARDLRWELDL